MTRVEALTKLRAHAADMRAMGAISLYLYGSTARDTAALSSDLDLFVEYDPQGRFNAFDLIGIQQFLEERLSSRIDVTTRDGLHPLLRDRIEQSAVRVF